MTPDILHTLAAVHALAVLVLAATIAFTTGAPGQRPAAAAHPVPSPRRSPPAGDSSPSLSP
jgi:hypothetical protein